MRIDLHLHSPMSSHNGDSINWISTSDTLKKLLMLDVKAFAFTDHNIFNKELYFEIRDKVKNHMIVFPGIEIDILKENGATGHMLVIFRNDLSNEEIDKIELIARVKLKKNGIKPETYSELFNDFDFIGIPHVGKSDYFTPSELSKLKHHAVEVTNLKHPNYLKWLEKNNDKSVVAFSDTHIWREYPQQSFLYTEMDFDGGFDSLKEKLLVNKNYTKENK